MDDWRPATVDEVNDIVASDLKACDSEQLATFEKFRVKPFAAPIMRYGKMESVVVVARNGDQVIYYEDVEDGIQCFTTQPGWAGSRTLVQSGRIAIRAKCVDRWAGAPRSIWASRSSQ